MRTQTISTRITLVAIITFFFLTVGQISAQDLSTSNDLPSSTNSRLNVEGQLGTCTPDNWDTTFTSNGTNNQVNVIVNDGLGNYYVGGNFTSVQGVPAAGIAKWNGTTWSPLGSGITGKVYAIAISGNDVYVGGDFFSPVSGGSARNVAKWNGSTWTALGSGLGGGTHYVKAVAVYNGEAYFGGSFTTSDGSPFSGITKWDGTSFQSAGNLIGEVKAFAQSNGLLYAGGAIGITAGVQIGIASFDGTTWASMGTANNTNINAITISGSNLYVVGGIFLPGVSQGAQFGRFNGTSWIIAGQFGISTMNAVAAIGSDAYIGGSFTGGYQNIAKWNGTSFVNFGTNGSGLNGTVSALATDGNKLLVGGNFSKAGIVGARNIATNTLGTWEGFSGTGLDNAAKAIAVSGTDVFVGGSFVSAGSATGNGIAKWNGTSWSALGTGFIGAVNAIAVAGNKVYVGGSSITLGGVNANRIAVWNGQNWSALGTGVNGTVTAIVVKGDDVYVGGDFQTAGGIATNRIAKWNGTSWSGFAGAPIPNIVTGLAFIGNDMYVGSNTTTLDNPNYLSKFDGTTWTGLATGMGGHGVSSLAVLGNDVYITGGFMTVGGISATQVAKWNGSTWSALGDGLPPGGFGFGGSIVGVSGTDIIAVGDFTVATGGPAEHVASWNGIAWSPLGNGLDATGSVVASGGGNIFVGGGFSRAGCNVSPYFARWRETVWTGMTNNDWHTMTNWGSGSVPDAGAGVTISANDVSITTADVTLSSLVVAGGRTLTIGAGRTLTVTGNVDLSNGNLNGTGSLVVDGDLNLAGGNMSGLGSVVVNGSLFLNGGGISDVNSVLVDTNLYLNSGNFTNIDTLVINSDLRLSGGMITGTGTVNITSCRTTAIVGGSSSSFIRSPLTRCVDNAGMYRFPVGNDTSYLPVDLSNVIGSSSFTVDSRPEQYPGGAAGLPDNRLMRWWSFQSGGISQADISVGYLNSEVVGSEEIYRGYTIAGGNATLVPTILDRAVDRATMPGVTVFSGLTLAEVSSSGTADLLGRVTTMTGRGAENVTVTLTESGGAIRKAVTNPFGYYRFIGVPTFRFHNVSVGSKKFRFAAPQRSVQFDQTLTNINFVSNSH